MTLRNLDKVPLRSSNEKVDGEISLVEHNFFDYFDLALTQGDKAAALYAPNSIILSEKTAKALFGDQSPIGKTIEVLGNYSMKLKVTGVIHQENDIHLKYENLISWESLSSNGSRIGDWFQYSVFTYTKTTSPEPSDLLSQKFSTNLPTTSLKRTMNLSFIHSLKYISIREISNSCYP